MNRPALAGARARALHLQERLRRARRRTFGVYGRLGALEAEVQENRQLNRRIAELTDVVAELLVPVADQDEDRVQDVLARYRASI